MGVMKETLRQQIGDAELSVGPHRSAAAGFDVVLDGGINVATARYGTTDQLRAAAIKMLVAADIIESEDGRKVETLVKRCVDEAS